MRSKEDAKDYRYFPDPDLPPICIPDEWIQKVKDNQPELREEKLERYKKDYDISEYDASLITESKHLADLFEETTAICNKPKRVANFILGELLRLLKEKEMDDSDISFSPENFAKLIELVDSGVVNSTVSKQVFGEIFENNVDPEVYIKENNLMVVNDDGELEKVIEEVISANPKSVEDYKAGKKKAIGFLVGQTMKAMQGKANPGKVNQILTEKLQ